MADNSGALGTTGAALGAATSFTGLGGLAGIGMMLGSLFGGGDDSEGGTDQLQQQIASILNSGLKNALGYSQNYTGQAVNQQNQSLQSAVDALTGYNQKAQQASTGAVSNAFNLSQQLRGPYGTAGYDALDAYKKTLGLSTVQGGSANQVQLQQQATQLAPQLQSLLKGMNGNYAPGTAPNLQSLLGQVTSNDINTYIGSNVSSPQGRNVWFYNGAGANPNLSLKTVNGQSRNMTYDDLMNNSTIRNLAQNAVGQQNYNTALNQYNTQNQNLSQAGSLLSGAQNNPQLMSLLAQSLRGKI